MEDTKDGILFFKLLTLYSVHEEGREKGGIKKGRKEKEERKEGSKE